MSNTVSRVVSILEEEITSISPESTNQLILNIKNAKNIFVAGAGRSKMVASMFAMRLMHCGFNVFVVSEIVTPSISGDDLLIIVSSSGSTSQLVEFASKANKLHSKICLITSNHSSMIGDVASHIVVVGSDSRSQVNCLPLGSRFELASSIYFELIVIMLMEQLGIDQNSMSKRHANLE